MDADNFEVIYPRRCDGICQLGPKALQLVDGVLGGNCPGPAPFCDETLVFKSQDRSDFVAQPTNEADTGQLACRNPRLVRAVRALIDQEVHDVLTQSAETKDY